jgi:cell division protein FtsL
MAARSSALRHGAEPAQRSADRAAARRAEQSKPVKSSRPKLGVVDRAATLEHARRRQARVLFFVSGLVVAAALTVAAAGHALLAATQIRADTLRGQLANAIATQQGLQLQRARLETPSRVLSIAEHRFKMISPSGATYLQPVNPGESVLQAHEPPRAAPRPAASHRSHSR